MARVLVWLVWWALSFALWLVFAGSLARSELVAGAAVAVAAATAAALLRDEQEVGARPRARELLRLWRPIVAVPRDLGRLTVVLVDELLRRDRCGAFAAIGFDTTEDERHAAARRVIGPTAGSFGPNTYVVGIDDEAGLMLVHQLVPTSDPRSEADPLELT